MSARLSKENVRFEKVFFPNLVFICQANTFFLGKYFAIGIRNWVCPGLVRLFSWEIDLHGWLISAAFSFFNNGSGLFVSALSSDFAICSILRSYISVVTVEQFYGETRVIQWILTAKWISSMMKTSEIGYYQFSESIFKP